MYAIEMVNIRKEFAGIVANDDITLRIKQHEIHALLGENGAGKSTLMSVLFGLYQPEHGHIAINGTPVSITNPNIANELGIGMVHQHFKLIDTFTVTENIILGSESTERGLLNVKDASRKIKQLSEQYGLNVDPNAYVRDISVGMQQRVEILKMLYRDADILIFDEPTAVLTPQETTELLTIIKRLQSEGKTILIITHKLREIKAVAQRCTILRLGKYITTVDVAATSEERLSELMVGHEVNLAVDKDEPTRGDVVLSLEDVSGLDAASLLQHMNLTVRAGEIFGVAGVAGNGQDELVEAITGLVKSSGTIELLGEDVSKLNIRARTRRGLAHIPADRHKHGLVLDFLMYENMALQEYDKTPLSQRFVLDKKAMATFADTHMKKFDVRSAQGIYSVARTLSGGNQQKAIVARELARRPKLLIAVQPTRGLDVGAIAFIHQQIVAARDAGAAVLLVSYELDEIMQLSDTIGVMYEGSMIETLRGKDATTTKLGLLMAGVKANDIQEGKGTE
jgi:simple sugar transport system ATP-binding protein